MSNDQYNQLRTEIQALGGRVTELDEQLSGKIDALDERLSGRIDAQDEQFAIYYRYAESRFDGIEAKLDQMASKEQVARLQEGIDILLGHKDAEELERGAMNQQLDRHEEWIERAADQLKIKYSRT